MLLRFIRYNLPLYTALSAAAKHPKPPTVPNIPEKLHQGEKRKLSSARGGEAVTTPKRVKTKGIEQV